MEIGPELHSRLVAARGQVHQAGAGIKGCAVHLAFPLAAGPKCSMQMHLKTADSEESIKTEALGSYFKLWAMPRLRYHRSAIFTTPWFVSP